MIWMVVLMVMVFWGAFAVGRCRKASRLIDCILAEELDKLAVVPERAPVG